MLNVAIFFLAVLVLFLSLKKRSGGIRQAKNGQIETHTRT